MENNKLENTYESKNFIIQTYFKTKVWLAVKMANLKKDDVILDFGCFPKGTLIYDDKLKEIPIEKIKKNDKILTANGNFKKVIKTFERKYKGNVYEIKTPYRYSLSATKEHPILSIKKEEVSCESHGIKCQRTCNTNLYKNKCSMCKKENKYLTPRYRCISTLKKRDYIAIPRNIKTNVKSGKNNLKLARLLGWYLAEGNQIYSHKPKICGVSFNLALNEVMYAEEIKGLAIELGATSVTVFKREGRNTITVNCFGKKLAEVLLKLGGKYSDKKELNPSTFNWTRKEHINLLQSYFLGDGHYRKGEYTIKSNSKKLIQQIKLIFNKYGISPCVNLYKPKNKNEQYSLILSGDDISFLRTSEKYPSKKRYRINKNYIFVPITKISKKYKRLITYNLKVEEDNTYIANGICVHNCGGGWLEKKLKDYKIYGYDINPEKTFIDDYKKISPTKIFVLDVFEHIPEKEIIKILNNFKKLNKKFGLIVSVPTENWLSRKVRKLVGKSEVPGEHITNHKKVLDILKDNFRFKKSINFFTVSRIFVFEHKKFKEE